MNIYLKPEYFSQGVEQGGPIPPGVARTTAYGAGDTRSTNGISLDISGFVKDNAYAGQGKTAEDVMSEIGAKDIATMQNYMTVMSNTLSKEDYEELIKDGCDPGQMPVGETVTVVDEIKAVMAEAGIVIEGYNDRIDKEAIKEITGNETYAQVIAAGFEKYGVEPTAQNIKDTLGEIRKLSEVGELSENAKAYMLINHLDLTSDHLFKAAFCGGSGNLRQGQGYFAESSDGYYGKMADQGDVDLLRDQIEKILVDAGLTTDADTMKEAAWIVENGIELTADHIGRLHEMNRLTFPLTPDQIADAAARAVSDGLRPAAADLGSDRTLLEKALQISKETEAVTDEILKSAVSMERTLSLTGLHSQEEIAVTLSAQQEKTYLTAKRQMEEIRLHMTVNANYQLLKKGIRLDTLPLERAVEALRSEEEAFGKLLFKEQPKPSESYRLWQETDLKVAQLKLMPAALVGAVSGKETVTIRMAHTSGSMFKEQYEKAGQTYEALMTAPRKDLGDSMVKAFRNVDDLLDSMGFSLTEENRRAVRILGYNRMEITGGSLEQIKNADALIQDVISRLTPAKTLQMIRDGINPLESSMTQLREYLSATDETDMVRAEKYSRFLYDLEQDQAITGPEKEAYIGIYRMLRQIEKSKGAAVGAVVHNGQEMSFASLLEAVRTRRTGGIDRRVAQDTGSLKEEALYRNSISGQIRAYFDAFSTKESTQMFAGQSLFELQESLQVSGEVLEELLANDQSVTPDHLQAQKEFSKNRGALYRRLHRLDHKETMQDSYSRLLESFTDADSVMKQYEEMTVMAKEVIEDAMEQSDASYIDVRSMVMMHKQISFASQLSKEENYEVPMTLEGELTSVNIRIIHERDKKGEVSASFEHEHYGRVQARFIMQQTGRIDGFVVTNEQEGLLRLRERDEDLCRNLLKESGKEADVKYVYQEKEVRPAYTRTEIDETVSTQILYQIAKGFLETFTN
ncbi:MAG: hypothetical protein E7294_12335 [Lachnospiraceae bacterium]|nr:hypothetical protein [Lachnospiraceae bacterium]